VKAAFIKSPNNFRGFKQSHSFIELINMGDAIYDNGYSACYIGYIKSLKCDYFNYEPKIHDPYLYNYDIIISLAPS
jgi:hypothetical protein